MLLKKATAGIIVVYGDIFNYFSLSLQKTKNNCTFRMKK